MRLGRLLRHLLTPDWWARRAFSKPAMRRIEQAIAASERRHGGELRVVCEANLPLAALWSDQSPRRRAIELAEAESEAQAATERMAIPTAMLLFGFVLLIGFPAVITVLGGL